MADALGPVNTEGGASVMSSGLLSISFGLLAPPRGTLIIHQAIVRVPHGQRIFRSLDLTDTSAQPTRRVSSLSEDLAFRREDCGMFLDRFRGFCRSSFLNTAKSTCSRESEWESRHEPTRNDLAGWRIRARTTGAHVHARVRRLLIFGAPRQIKFTHSSAVKQCRHRLHAPANI